MRRRAILVALGAVAVVATGCGGDDGASPPETTEAAAPGASVDVDAADGRVRVSEEDGTTFESDGDGTFTASGEEGGFRATVDGAAELPDEWPDDVAVPPGSRLTATIVDDRSDPVFVKVDGDVPGEVDAVHRGFVDRLTGAGYEVTGDDLLATDGGQVGSLTASGPAGDLVISTGGADGVVVWSISALLAG